MTPIRSVEYPAVGISALEPDRMKELPVYAKEVPGTAPADKSSTGHYRNVQSFDKLVTDFPNIKTLHDLFQNGLRVNPKGHCLGHRPVYYDHETKTVVPKDYVWQTYEAVNERVKSFANGVMKIGTDLKLKDRFNLGIYSVNNPEYAISDYSAHLFSLTLVALYDTLGEETSQFILNHSEIPIIVTTLDKISKLIALSPKCPHLKAVILMDGNLPKSPEVSTAVSIGKQANPRAPRLPSPDDVAVISYTSGTTGTPKGAMVTHKNIMSYIRSLFDVGIIVTTNDVHISYLPLAHIYEKGVINLVLLCGGSVGFCRGDTSLLLDDIANLRPTVFVSVPRLLNRIYEKIQAGAASGSALKQALFQRAVSTKLENLKRTGSVTHPIWDRLVFGNVRAVLGGRVRMVISGSAPITPDVLSFLRIAFCCTVQEGYGATESASGTSIVFKGDIDPGHVGAPLTCNEIKLVSVPEMRYSASDKPFPRGEIWVRGGNVFKGYLKDEEKTKDTVTADGWLKTGDIGFIDEKGRVHIIDPCSGEYVAPEKIENVYQKSTLVAQIYVHGDSLQAELVAIVVPDHENAIPLARELGVLPADTPNPDPKSPAPISIMKTICSNNKMKELIFQDMNKIGKQFGLKGFEFAKAIHLDAEGFSAENGLITPTFKLKRNEAADKFRPQIDAMYKVLNENAVKGKI
ncbi:acetyl-CoA synthetase-like protein [Rhizoclosmatium globosum]|uniref:Acetyl-CoA synthetase-like protein n=1 Tax=Rhizoclosmatium globosum TaxID=329046 RepID=A0A1Y2CNM5_9FUNG|nr:acetyl-CoA synthetase-like protein [Rhizoclosmatium globosum]|eukprot:ORY48444.1 acetyl-CoA synthetase-like protein [Rhizoclosmatium globosum]